MVKRYSEMYNLPYGTEKLIESDGIEGKIFCKDCKHVIMTCYNDPPSCDLGIKVLDPVKGEVKKIVWCRDRNKNFDCKLFELKPPKPPKKKSNWFRLRKQ